MIAAILPVVAKLLDKVIPDPVARDAAKLELLRAEHAGELQREQIQLSAILAEAQSSDPWTSRARPSFLYVVYTVILAGIPMGFLFAVSPDVAASVTQGFKQWLAAIPSEMWTLFGIGYLGYTGARTIDKARSQ